MHRDELITQILEMELNMFLSVRARDPVSCQEHPEMFRVNRAAQFSAWSEQTLASYREDLARAEEQGENLMTLKYARMENLISNLHDVLTEDLIDQIVAIQVEWQKEMIATYPYLMKRGRPLDQEEEAREAVSFVNYLRSELETYSADTLAHLFGDVTESRANDRSMTRVIYENLVGSYGYATIEEAEGAARREAGR